MRMLLMAQMDTEKASGAIESGSLPEIMQATMDQLKPEAAYFVALQGKRTALMFFDLEHASDIPSIAEPLFGRLGAQLTLVPAMDFDDVSSGLGRLG
ncbi:MULTISPECIES: hypothetical protein [Streptomyces]|uniref:Muconolactone isomerase domain-containing protein n=1 Tax=Streptomyces albus (strain ATCC 21838 / DSM 41398 / FERM P-419 / JCM 4703 / NBRC 107858) TaxID=1081613 RepID=A0A0B5F4U2_STRA4|nr:hypothetical protein [Streptomyces sp. SCSIO ZS0520]AJE85342.1 hypothetical protein SLNWT_4966 [Streptomyces albus]AOU79649.1 hypothetical protein SLNHY_4958 [Streptomyces albus]AYN35370.1 hypothetical protein DUI70_4872 [Streptomyces albus]